MTRAEKLERMKVVRLERSQAICDAAKATGVGMGRRPVFGEGFRYWSALAAEKGMEGSRLERELAEETLN